MLTYTAEVPVTILADVEDAKAFLRAQGTPGPSLHPNAAPGTPDRQRWNGWNRTLSAGMDAAERFVILGLLVYADGHDGLTTGVDGDTPYGGSIAGTNVEWPVRIIGGARSVIIHTQHTPTPHNN